MDYTFLTITWSSSTSGLLSKEVSRPWEASDENTSAFVLTYTNSSGSYSAYGLNSSSLELELSKLKHANIMLVEVVSELATLQSFLAADSAFLKESKFFDFRTLELYNNNTKAKRTELKAERKKPFSPVLSTADLYSRMLLEISKLTTQQASTFANSWALNQAFATSWNLGLDFDFAEAHKLSESFEADSFMFSHYFKPAQEVTQRLGRPSSHGYPELLGALSGRIAYNNARFGERTALAMHSLPKEGGIRELFKAPKGYKFAKFDAKNQDICFLAWASQDSALISVINSGKDIHTLTASHMLGFSYLKTEMKLRRRVKKVVAMRKVAKLVNLSCIYRISANSLQKEILKKFKVEYTLQEVDEFKEAFFLTFPGIRAYWKSACLKAEDCTYAESIGGRRLHFENWKTGEWQQDSSAINFPIQASGADQRDYALNMLTKEFEEATFVLDIHDELVFLVKEDSDLFSRMLSKLNSLDYAGYWKTSIPMKLQFTGELCNTL